MSFVSRHIIKNIHAYCVDVDPVKTQEAFAHERAELDIEQKRLRERKRWEESEYNRLRQELFGDDDGQSGKPDELAVEPTPDVPAKEPAKDDTHKVCAGCGKSKPLIKFRVRRSGERFPYCKDCQKSSEQEMRRKYGHVTDSSKPRYKTCRQCGMTKETRFFSISVRSEDGRRFICKDCVRSNRKK